MPRNGSGTFNRVYDWTDDAANGINIRADRMDEETDGIATALSESIARDGQTVITANLKMSGFKHTDVADADARDQYAVVGQTQDSAYTWAGTSGGTADAQTISVTPAITAYAAGQVFRFTAGSGLTNTGAMTLAVNGLTAKSVKSSGGDDVAPDAVTAGETYTVIYNGTNFILIGSPLGTAATENLAANGGTIPETDLQNTFDDRQTISKAGGATNAWTSQSTDDAAANILEGWDSSGNTIGRIVLAGLDGAGAGRWNFFDADAYRFDTMPDVSGTPIVESGSNSDGEWVRYSDGTQIVSKQNFSRSSTPETWTFPASFDASPSVSLEIVSSTARLTSVDNHSNTSVDTYVQNRSDGSNSTANTDNQAIGTWS